MGIVSPQSSLARLNGCDGYIAQVWTGTAREANFYQGTKKERTFETAFLEYGSMQNLVRSTGREVWYLADPIEDNPDHDWGDYRRNYHSTLVASLLQPDVSQYEVMPWPERIFNGKYPSELDPKVRVPIPEAYATELQVVIHALKDMKQRHVRWASGSHGIGVLVSDSLMFQRGGPSGSDNEFGHFYGLAMPFVKRGMPVQPVQLENVTLPGYLKGLKLLIASYDGQKPLTPDVHPALAAWVKAGGNLVFVDNDEDPYNAVREWWNQDGMSYKNPRQHLFELIGGLGRVGKGSLTWLKDRPGEISRRRDGGTVLAEAVRQAAPGFAWKESSALVLRRGPYVIASGMDETDAPRKSLRGRFVDLFDPELKPLGKVELGPGARHFLIDLAKWTRPVVACAGSVVELSSTPDEWVGTVEGIGGTQGVLLLRAAFRPERVLVDRIRTREFSYDWTRGLLWVRFPLKDSPQKVRVEY